jgi:hypothetical protein
MNQPSFLAECFDRVEHVYTCRYHHGRRYAAYWLRGAIRCNFLNWQMLAPYQLLNAMALVSSGPLRDEAADEWERRGIPTQDFGRHYIESRWVSIDDGLLASVLLRDEDPEHQAFASEGVRFLYGHDVRFASRWMGVPEESVRYQCLKALLESWQNHRLGTDFLVDYAQVLLRHFAGPLGTRGPVPRVLTDESEFLKRADRLSDGKRLKLLMMIYLPLNAFQLASVLGISPRQLDHELTRSWNSYFGLL